MGRHLAICLLAAVLTACADDGTGPKRAPEPEEVSRLPLAVGSTWTYEFTLDATWTYQDGSEANPPEHLAGTVNREIIGPEIVDGREYVVETLSAVTDGGPLEVAWRRFRQDGDALYQADVSTAVPPNKVPDEEFGETVRLRFPVAVGESWQLRPGSNAVTLTVEAHTTLALEIGETPAWRVRVRSASAGPDDYRLLWYGTEGLLRIEDHAEFDATDITSGDIVHVVIHEVQVVTSTSPVAP